MATHARADPGCTIARLRVNSNAEIYEADAAELDAPLPSPLSSAQPEASTSRLPDDPPASEPAEPESAQEQSVKREKRRKERFLSCLAKDTVDVSALKKLAWNGIPPELRPLTWQLLLVRRCRLWAKS
jgi:hypothetical protein